MIADKEFEELLKKRRLYDHMIAKPGIVSDYLYPDVRNHSKVDVQGNRLPNAHYKAGTEGAQHLQGLPYKANIASIISNYGKPGDTLAKPNNSYGKQGDTYGAYQGKGTGKSNSSSGHSGGYAAAGKGGSASGNSSSGSGSSSGSSGGK